MTAAASRIMARPQQRAARRIRAYDDRWSSNAASVIQHKTYKVTVLIDDTSKRCEGLLQQKRFFVINVTCAPAGARDTEDE